MAHGLPEAFVARLSVRDPVWLAGLPALIEEAERRWNFIVERPMAISMNFVAEVRRGDGTPAVFKAGPPDHRIDLEIAALAHFAGRGVVTLLEADPARGMMLAERIQPGTALWDTSVPDDEATEILARAMVGLRRPLPAGHAFPHVRDWAKALPFHREARGGGTGTIPERLFQAAEATFENMPGGPDVLLHGDFHHGNVLDAGAGGWVVIDPQGVVGPPEYEAGAMIRNPGDFCGRTDSAALIGRRVQTMARVFQVPEALIREWCIAVSVLSACWSQEDGGSRGKEAIAAAELVAALP